MGNVTPRFGKDLSFKIEPVGGTSSALSQIVDISKHVMSVDGLPGEREYSDITCGAGTIGHELLPGLIVGDFSVQCVLDQTSSGNYASAWKTLSNFSTDTESRYFAYAAAGTCAGYPNITGRAWVKGITLPIKPLEAMTFTVSCSVDSTLTVTVCG